MAALDQYVFVDGVLYKPGDSPPPEVADKIRNPEAWAGENVPPLSTSVFPPPGGSDGRVLTADSTKIGAGVRWALPASDAARTLYTSGQYYNPWSPDTSGTAVNLNNGQLRLVPVLFPSPVTISRIGAEVATAGSVGALYRPLVYADDGTGYPGALLLDAGALDAATVGFKESPVATTLSGLVWMGGVVQGNPATQPTMRIGFERPVVPIRLGATPVNATAYGYQAAGVTGTPPASFSAGASNSGSGPRLFIRVA